MESKSGPDLWIARPDGSGARLLARRAGLPVWSPDGRRLAFGRQGERAGVYVVGVDGGGERRLTTDAATTSVSVLSWSPDGRTVAFHRGFRPPGGAYGPGRAGDIHLVGVDGSRVRRLTRHGLAHYRVAAWTPDGRRIAIVSAHEGNPEVYTVDADGRDARRLTHNSGWDSLEGWSPDGRHLLVAVVPTRNSLADLWVISADGRRRANLTRSAGNEYGGAAWSPDGRRIAFVRIDGFVGPGQVHVMNADGSGQRDLGESTVPDFAPSWSPDGRRLTFTAHPGAFHVRLIHADGSRKSTLVSRGGAFPTWSPATG